MNHILFSHYFNDFSLLYLFHVCSHITPHTSDFFSIIFPNQHNIEAYKGSKEFFFNPFRLSCHL